MDWGRKHLCELLSASRNAERDSTLSAAERLSFAFASGQAKKYVSLPDAGGSVNVLNAVSMVCDACRLAYRYPCAGRAHWIDPCQFLDERRDRQEARAE